MSSNSEIQRLILEMNERKEIAEKWDRWNIRFIFLAGFVAVCLGITAIGVSRSNSALVAASEGLNKAKDSQLALDLKNKDGEIAHAQELAGKAHQRAEELAKENVEIKGTINRSVADTLLREEELKAKNLATETKLESERNTRLELEKSLIPRQLSFVINAGKSNIDPLKPFAGVDAIIEFIPDDAEARRAAGSIAEVIRHAGWRIVEFTPSPKVFFDGVNVDRYSAPIPTPMTAEAMAERQIVELRSQHAASALVDFLQSNDWVANEGSAAVGIPGETIPPDSVRIRVGLKPSPYFDPDWVKKIEKQSKEMREQMKKFENERRPNEK